MTEEMQKQGDVEQAKPEAEVAEEQVLEVTRREFMRRSVKVAVWMTGFFALGAALSDRAYATCVWCGGPHGVDDGYPGGWCFGYFVGMGGHYHDPDQHACIGTFDCTDKDSYNCPTTVICESQFACATYQYQCVNRDFSCDAAFNCCYYKCNTTQGLHHCFPSFNCTPTAQYTHC